jgi:hypothetical protein|tara:strand:- start:654 stop:875 length:222 start_codon:yes stop_codon:yes gene_type:complete
MVSKLNQIINKPTATDREKVDELLFLDAQIYANLGTDSTSLERAVAKVNSILIYEAIQKVDHSQGVEYLRLLK